MIKYFKIFSLVIFILGSIAITPTSRADFLNTGGGISLPGPVQKVINDAGGIKINIDLGGFINRLKSDFRPKEWASRGKIVQGLENVWTEANGWMESHLGVSIQKIGSFIGSIFVWVFKLLAGIFKKIF